MANISLSRSAPLKTDIRIKVQAPTHVSGTLEFESGAIATLIISFDLDGTYAAAHRDLRINGIAVDARNYRVGRRSDDQNVHGGNTGMDSAADGVFRVPIGAASAWRIWRTRSSDRIARIE
ncbi:MAG: hypothetical protein U0528_16010 [Anaerolineae bacterium]